MASKLVVEGRGDLDDIFDAYESGAKPAATEIKVGSQDLRDRYNPISEGDGITFATRLYAAGTDLRHIFAAKGTSAKPNASASYILTATRSGMGGTQYTISDGISFCPDGTCDGASNWLTRVGAGKGARWQIRVDIASKLVQAGTTLNITNELASWTTMTALKNVNAVYTSRPTSAASHFTMRVRIRRVDTLEVVYDNTTPTVQNRFLVALA